MVSSTTIAYLVLNILAMVLDPILGITFAYDEGVPRHPTILNNLALWTLQSVSSCLLLFSGNVNSDHPPLGLCKFQSAMQYGAPPGLAAGAFTVVCRVWYMTWSVNTRRVLNAHSGPRIPMPVYVGFPYLIWLAVALPSGLISGDNVHRYDRYCATPNQLPAIISGVFTGGFLIIAVTLQSWAMFIVFTRYRVSRKVGPQETGQNVSLFIRISAFTILMLLALILTIVAATMTWSQATPDILLASIALGIFFIFASQPDVLHAWRMSKRPSSTSLPQAPSAPSNPTASNEKDTAITLPQLSLAEEGNASTPDAYPSSEFLPWRSRGSAIPQLMSFTSMNSTADRDHRVLNLDEELGTIHEND